MTKRKGLFDIDVDVRGLLEELPNLSSTAPKTKDSIDYYANHTESLSSKCVHLKYKKDR